MGEIEIAVYVENAPASAGSFLEYVADGSYARQGAFYRAVRREQNDLGRPVIDVIQGGMYPQPQSMVGVQHESTAKTGLRHLDGAVSLARRAIGTASGAAFFICIADQPALDVGGGRNSDGEGFAAFGCVTPKTMETVRRIHQLPTGGTTSDPYLRGQTIDTPIRILRAQHIMTPAS